MSVIHVAGITLTVRVNVLITIVKVVPLTCLLSKSSHIRVDAQIVTGSDTYTFSSLAKIMPDQEERAVLHLHSVKRESLAH
jgi:hypothetical protein